MVNPPRGAVAVVASVAMLLAACADDSETSATPTDPQPSSRATSTTAGFEPESVPAEPSAGCDSGGGPPAADSVETISVAGGDREYQRHLPPGRDESTPLPLVLDFHGYSEGASIHARHSDLGSFGDDAGFVTITPQGQGAVPLWDFGADSVDVELTGAILDAEEAALCVDTNRIYVTGLSNGAMMTSTIACELEDRIAAVAPVAGIRDPDACEFDRPVPVVAFHGTEDNFVSYEGGLGPAVADLPTPDGSGDTLGEADDTIDEPAGGDSVPELVAAWAQRNDCEPAAEEEQVADDVTLIGFDCPSGSTTELYRVDGGGHTWPGSEFSDQIEDIVGPTTFSIDANEIMWDFFQAHPKR